MGSKVFKAVIPAAGRGTRMRPLSRVLPKEMMPVGRKPMIQLAIEEAIAAGIHDICIVIRKEKEIIRDYLLKRALQGPDSSARTVLQSCKLTFAYQKKWDGLGGALGAAKSFVGQDSFLMIIPDQLLIGGQRSLASRQLVSRYKFAEPVVLSSMVKIPKRDVNYFHGSRGFVLDGSRARYGRPVAISRVQSEVHTRRSFTQLSYEIRGFGRTVFPAAIFPYLGHKFINLKTGEIDLWKTFQKFPDKIPHFGCLLIGRACDLGTFDGYRHYLPFFLDH